MKKIRRAVFNWDINRIRFYLQIFSFGALMYGGYLAVDLGNHLPTFACPFADKAGGACYLFPLQHQLNIPLPQFFGSRGMGILTGFLTFLALLVLLNKSWCGFLCPLGAVQDWISKIRRGLGIRYSTYSEKTAGRLKVIKYVLLALLILLPLGMSNSVLGLPKLSHDFSTPYCMICPGRTVLPLFHMDAGQLVVDFSSGAKTVLTALGMGVTGLFFAGAFVKRRFFCLFCPMSALQYLFSRASVLRLTKRGEKCTRCGNCFRVCDMGIRDIAEDLESTNIVKDDCMMCFNCVAACPENECLKVSFLGMTIYQSTEEGYYRRMERACAGGSGSGSGSGNGNGNGNGNENGNENGKN